MDIFKVIQPSDRLAPYIKQYWYLSIDNALHGAQRLVPFGCVGIGFHKLSQSHVWAQTTGYTELTYNGNVRFIAVILQPAAANAIFGFPASRFEGRVVPIDLLEDKEWLELEARLADETDITASVSLIETFLTARIRNFANFNYERINSVIRSINNGRDELADLAKTACLGDKQFRRLFHDFIGINPKDYIRITRFQRTMLLLQTKPQQPLSQIAEDCGYYDKSHLVKELKTFSGLTPKEFLSVCDPYSEYHSLFRSAFIDNPHRLQ